MQKYIVMQLSGTAACMVTAQVPQVFDVYDTERYGELKNFSVCDASLGDVVFHTDVRGRRGEYEVVINDVTYGDAEFPDEYTFVAQFKSYV